ncbi:hypothetical protein XELAEV_18019659mg [Xenopus laevis]|uniref:Olfactory receptor n=1 Tax=Xenopus laevis TaxID=8355 RepID=A0A974HUR8_XENLA|nr:hypothetical protein XELAEV_18019659mg [Xenopus laevis]
MQEKNQTLVSEIILLGFQNLQNIRIYSFSLFLLIYIITVCENVLIIVLVSSSRNLQSPMYFFLQQLALSDLLQITNILPILLQTIIYGRSTLSLVGCITQLYFFGASEACEFLLLSVMSFDRYVAICIPLRYTSILNHRVCFILILMSWVLGFGIAVVTANLIGALEFCDQNTINHFFCDFYPLLELSCSDTFSLQFEAFFLFVPMVFLPFILVIVSYVCIARAILKISSDTGRQKAFSTCSSHMTVVSIFYGNIIAIYLFPPKKQSSTINKVLSLLYTIVIPMVNPVIYSLRNKEIKEALKVKVNQFCKSVNI